jgi:hypothetical protein
MKIFVWNVDFMESWTPGLAVVIAENEKEAMRILWEKLEKDGSDYDRVKKQVFTGPDEVHDLKPSTFYTCGGS